LNNKGKPRGGYQLSNVNNAYADLVNEGTPAPSANNDTTVSNDMATQPTSGFSKGGIADSSNCTSTLSCSFSTISNALCNAKKMQKCSMDWTKTIPITPSFLNAGQGYSVGKHNQNHSVKDAYANLLCGSAHRAATGGIIEKYRNAAPKGHNPEFITGITGYYACGKGTGQSDDIPAMLHDGDYVMDAETVAQLGDGSSKAGREVLDGFRNKVPHKDFSNGGSAVPAKIADGEYVFPAAFVTALGKGSNKEGSKILDGLRERLREHKRSAPVNKIPPKSKSPLDYIKMIKD
jgi:hypothetical protein